MPPDEGVGAKGVGIDDGGTAAIVGMGNEVAVLGPETGTYHPHVVAIRKIFYRISEQLGASA
jgi:hypothetical protein